MLPSSLVERDGYFHKGAVFFSSETPVGPDYGGDKFKGALFYNIEHVRDAVNCQAYFSSNGSLPAPNFFQRMLEKPWEYTDEQYGMFSFLVGKEFKDLPSIDFLYYQALEEGCQERSYYVAGLAGTKNPAMVDGYSMVNKLNLPIRALSDIRWMELKTDIVACEPSGAGGSSERAE